jgi:hypothetical protein
MACLGQTTRRWIRYEANCIVRRSLNGCKTHTRHILHLIEGFAGRGCLTDYGHATFLRHPQASCPHKPRDPMYNTISHPALGPESNFVPPLCKTIVN